MQTHAIEAAGMTELSLEDQTSVTGGHHRVGWYYNFLLITDPEAAEIYWWGTAHLP